MKRGGARVSLFFERRRAFKTPVLGGGRAKVLPLAAVDTSLEK
jgi:hypothetical protein